MDESLTSSVPAVASAVAAIASAFAAVWLAKLTSRTLQLQIEPSISIDFDHDASHKRRRVAVVTNDSACDITDLSVRVSIPGTFEERDDGALEATVLKLVGDHNLQRWIIPKLWRRKVKGGTRFEIDSDSWFIHAREVLAIPNLSDKEKAIRGIIILDMMCRRAADNRKFNFEYVYRVHLTDDWLYIALPIRGSNPADAEKRLIVAPKKRSSD